MTGQMAIPIALPGKNDVGNPEFFFFFFFFITFFTDFLRLFKGEKNFLFRSLILQNVPSHSVLFSSSLICATPFFHMPLEEFSFVKTLVTDPLLQNMTKIVCLR